MITYGYQNIGHFFLGFWGILLVLFLIWKSYGISSLKGNIARLKDDEIVTILNKFNKSSRLIRLIKYIFYSIYLVIIIISVQILINITFFSFLPKDIYPLSLLLVGAILPTHFGFFIVLTIFSDVNKILKNAEEPIY